MEENKDMTMLSFQIIGSAGDARSFAFMALNAAKKGDFAAADDFMKKSDEANKKAHQLQTDLLVDSINGNDVPVDILLVHSQDHLMTAMLANELIKEMIELYKKQFNVSE